MPRHDLVESLLVGRGRLRIEDQHRAARHPNADQKPQQREEDRARHGANFISGC